jgi:DNA-binding CsgD family transcriptional regulator
VRYLQRALDEPPEPGEARVAMRLELGRLQLALGRMQALATLRAAYDESEVAERRAEIALTLADGLVEAERLDEAMDLVRRIQETLDLGPDQWLESDAVLIVAAIDRGIEPEEMDGVAARIPSDLPGATPAERRALTVRAYLSMLDGRPIAETRTLLARAASDEDLRTRPTVTQWHMRTASLAGLLEQAEDLAEELLDLARATGAESLFAGAQLQLAVTANQRGELRDCEAALRLGLASPGCTPQIRIQLEDWLITTLSMQGHFAEAEQLLLSSLAGREENLATMLMDRRHVELALDRGDYAAAIEPAERLLGEIDRRIHAANAVAADYALALCGLGRLEEAEPYARNLLEQAERLGRLQTIGIGLHALGCALRGAEGIEYLQRAVTHLAETPYRWNQANAEVALGGALRRDGQRVAAREPLRSALDYAVRSGAAPIERRAREELLLAGARPRRAVRTGIDALTPSEARIARLAAEGMTNRELAAHLFLTVRTVEMHLGAAYRKLDIAGRRDLPALFTAG